MATRSPPTPAAPATVFYRPETYEPDESAAYLMRRILVCMAAQVDAALEPRDLTNAQWVPLFKLYRGDASTVAELARECQLDTGAMTRTLDRLEAKGLVARVRSSADRRMVNLELTAAGREAAKEIPVVLSDVQNAFLQGLSVPEWQQLKSLLRRILDNGRARQAAAAGKE
jgi:Transcriptional regulators